MSQRVIIGIISMCVALAGLFLSNMLFTMMIGEINRTRKDGSLVSYFGFTFPKMLRIFGECRSSFPNGRMHIYALAAFALTITGLLGVAICLRIVGRYTSLNGSVYRHDERHPSVSFARGSQAESVSGREECGDAVIRQNGYINQAIS